MFFSNNYEEEFRTYCEPCPRPEEILWKNIGIIEKQGFKVKVLSVIYFILILGFFVAFLYFFMEVVYVEPIAEPFKTILTNFILLFIVFVALTFRSLMGRLSEMRYPNTYTNRAMFIVITTVLFHFIFYLFIPSVYLTLHDDLRGAILSLISNQAINFILIQVTLAGFDLMYCCWNRQKGKTENEEKPIGCQKILHEKMQYPRFPIEFKLIILFKIWSLITFFAF
jgi:magnesium-transporting ATPase (P-type)